MRAANVRTLGDQVKVILNQHWKCFQPEFRQWLRENWRLYLVFHDKAEVMRKHRDHYSARTIIEVMRWHSDLHEKDVTFKIGNNAVPDMARLYNKLVDVEFFRERERP